MVLLWGRVPQWVLTRGRRPPPPWRANTVASPCLAESSSPGNGSGRKKATNSSRLPRVSVYFSSIYYLRNLKIDRNCIFITQNDVYFRKAYSQSNFATTQGNFDKRSMKCLEWPCKRIHENIYSHELSIVQCVLICGRIELIFITIYQCFKKLHIFFLSYRAF